MIRDLVWGKPRPKTLNRVEKAWSDSARDHFTKVFEIETVAGESLFVKDFGMGRGWMGDVLCRSEATIDVGVPGH